MLIVCDNCGAEYEIDEDEVSGQSSRAQRFRCNACGHTFSIGDDPQSTGHSSGGHELEPPDQPVAPPPMLLRQEGKVYQVDDVATLQRWIVERRVLREDMLSIGGLKWEPVGGRRDLQVFFHLVDHTDRLSLSGQGMSSPPIDAAQPGGGGIQGTAPWEIGADIPLRDPVELGVGVQGEATGAHASQVIDSGEIDAEEAELEDEGTDAGLPMEGQPPTAWARPGGTRPETSDDSDSFFTEAGEAGLPVGGAAKGGARGTARAPVKNLAGSLSAEDGPTEELKKELAPDPLADMRFPGEPVPRFRAPHPLEDLDDLGPPPERPAQSNTLVWALGAVLLAALVGVIWFATRPAPTDDGPVDAAPPGLTEPVSPPPAAPAAPVEGRPDAGAPAAPVAPPAAQVPAADPTPPADPARPAAEPPPAAQAPPAAEPPPSAEEPPVTARIPAPATPTAQMPPPAAATGGRSAAQLVEQGWTHIEGGRFSDARASFAAALDKSPGSVDARFGLGYSFEKLGDPDAAVRYYCMVAGQGAGDARIEAEGRLRALERSCE